MITGRFFITKVGIFFFLFMLLFSRMKMRVVLNGSQQPRLCVGFGLCCAFSLDPVRRANAVALLSWNFPDRLGHASFGRRG